MRRIQLFGTLLIVAATTLAACAPYGARTAGKRVYVGPYQRPCVGVAPQMCMLVRGDAKDDWRLFYDEIEGFAYEPGFEYELRVQEEKIENPPADASSLRWTLLEIVSKERSLEGTTWILDLFVDSDGQPVPPLPGTQITVLFADGKLGGDAGCNSYTGQYSTTGSNLTVSLGAMTMMYCGPDEVMQQEQEFVAALGNAAFYQIEEGTLRIANKSADTILQFRAQEPTPLVGSVWHASWYNNGKGGYTSILGGTVITALFGEDGSLTGSAGCNNYTTSYKLENDSAARGSISIGPSVTTRKFCAEPEGIMDQESAYLKALESTATYEIRGEELELRDATGSRMVTFTLKSESAGLDEESLKNMAYQSEWGEAGTVQLSDGEYRTPAAPGSASEIVVQIVEPIVYGELNGEPAAAVILASSGGGSGTFMDLAIVVEQDGQTVNVAVTPLGDRAQINSVIIEDNEVVVDMITHGPQDAMCCPTQQVVRTFALQEDQLVETSADGIADTQSLAGVVWQWLSFIDPLNKATIDDPTMYTLEFGNDGSVSAKADCNQANGTYAAENDGQGPSGSITIEIMTSTMAMCAADSMSEQFIKYLNEAAIYSFDGENLLLDLPVDTGTMVFAPGG